MIFWIALVILIALYLIVHVYRSAKEERVHQHGLCCDECKIRDECDKYKNR